jgi:pimeloyl-ACP methyl ester carboxylesterase
MLPANLTLMTRGSLLALAVVAHAAGAQASAPQLPAICATAGIDSITMPLRHGTATSPMFTYRYQVIPALGDAGDQPTVIVLPGRPGQASIGNAATTLSLGAVPATYPRIYTDPRGAGCNAIEPLADTTQLTTESLARDVIAIITTRRLTNYILYGASYGTVLATTTASLIEQQGLAPPRAVVLEGVVGQAFPDFATYMQAFAVEWRRVRPTLANDWGARLASDSLPYGYTDQQYGTLIAATLILGDLAMPPYEGPVIEYALNALDRYHTLKRTDRLSQMTRADSAAMAYVEGRLGIRGGFAAPITTSSRAELFASIGCKELWGDWRSGRALVRGELVATGSNICRAGKSNAFDARAWPIRTAPIYYFQGPHDPTSTLASALYHFEQQSSARRTFVLVEGASHAPLSGGLRRCAANVWLAIVQQTTMTDALVGCPRRAGVRERGP